MKTVTGKEGHGDASHVSQRDIFHGVRMVRTRQQRLMAELTIEGNSDMSLTSSLETSACTSEGMSDYSSDGESRDSVDKPQQRRKRREKRKHDAAAASLSSENAESRSSPKVLSDSDGDEAAERLLIAKLREFEPGPREEKTAQDIPELVIDVKLVDGESSVEGELQKHHHHHHRRHRRHHRHHHRHHHRRHRRRQKDGDGDYDDDDNEEMLHLKEMIEKAEHDEETSLRELSESAMNLLRQSRQQLSASTLPRHSVTAISDKRHPSRSRSGTLGISQASVRSLQHRKSTIKGRQASGVLQTDVRRLSHDTTESSASSSVQSGELKICCSMYRRFIESVVAADIAEVDSETLANVCSHTAQQSSYRRRHALEMARNR